MYILGFYNPRIVKNQDPGFNLLSPIRAAEIVECVRKFVIGISQNLQSFEPLLTMSFHSVFVLTDYD